MLATSTGSRQRRKRTASDRKLKLLMIGNRPISYRSSRLNHRVAAPKASADGKWIFSLLEAVHTENILELAQSFSTAACTSNINELGGGAATRVTAPVPIRTLERVNRAFKDDDLKIQTRAGSICAKP